MKSLPQQLESSFDRVISEHNTLSSQIAYLEDEFMRHAIMGLLERSLGNVREASREAGMHWDSLWNLIRKHRIDPSVYVSGDTYVCPDPIESPQ